MRAALFALGLIAATPGMGVAQDTGQTLADIRQELTVLYVELRQLGRELVTTGAPLTGAGSAGDTQARLDAIEAEMRRLTRLTETLELRIDQVVRDGTTRVGDLEFRLCELEPDCDIASLGETPSLGGVDLAGPAATTLPAAGAGAEGGASLAVGEQSDFDRARAAFEAGDYAQAAQLFTAFTETYPGGPLSTEANFLRGEAEAAQGDWSAAARAFLASFSGDPSSARAPDALMRLGTSLAEIGQTEEACLTLAEVERRYPGAAAVAEAQRAMAGLGCL